VQLIALELHQQVEALSAKAAVPAIHIQGPDVRRHFATAPGEPPQPQRPRPDAANWTAIKTDPNQRRRPQAGNSDLCRCIATPVAKSDGKTWEHSNADPDRDGPHR
jgi:hypothetical protein